MADRMQRAGVGALAASEVESGSFTFLTFGTERQVGAGQG